MNETMQEIQDIIESSLVSEGYEVILEGANTFTVLAPNGSKFSVSFCTENEIRGFFGKYRFLSNFFCSQVRYNGITYQNNEAAFQAQKCPSRAAEFATLNPSDAKRLGRRVPLRGDWESVKYAIMKEIVYAKFSQNTTLLNQLLDTGNAKLFEENTWGDMVWGTVDGQGCNYLGKILEEVRNELRKELNK